MKSLHELVKAEEKYIENLLLKTEKVLEKFGDTDAVLWIDHHHGKPQFYECRKDLTTGERNRVYIPQKEFTRARFLAQKDYLEKAKKQMLEQLEILRKFERKYDSNFLLYLYESLHEDRKKLLCPLVLPDDQFIEQWENYQFEPKGFSEGFPAIISERGERVRSKSEKIIADKLYMTGIPYRYECPLWINNSMVIHPDFTALNKRTREIYYWEHFGMVGDNKYGEEMVRRIDLYESNGIFLGEQLLATFETKQQPLTKEALDRLIRKYLL